MSTVIFQMDPVSSSSASLELLIGVIAEKLYDLHLDRLDSGQIGKQTENHFIGVTLGSWTNLPSVLGGRSTGYLSRYQHLEYDLVPLDLKAQCRGHHEYQQTPGISGIPNTMNAVQNVKQPSLNSKEKLDIQTLGDWISGL